MIATRFKTRNRKRLKAAPTGVLKPGSAPKSGKNGAEIQRSAGSTTDHKRSPPEYTVSGGSRRHACCLGTMGECGWLLEAARQHITFIPPAGPGSRRASRRAPMALRTARLAAADYGNGRRRCPQAHPVAPDNNACTLVTRWSRRKSFIPAATARIRRICY